MLTAALLDVTIGGISEAQAGVVMRSPPFALQGHSGFAKELKKRKTIQEA